MTPIGGLYLMGALKTANEGTSYQIPASAFNKGILVFTIRGHTMNELTRRVLQEARERGIIPETQPTMPMAYVSSAELYLTFYCNDTCQHCLTDSGANRKEMISPEDAHQVVENISKYSILDPLQRLYGNGEYRFTPLPQCQEVDEMKEPPDRLTYALMQTYNVCAVGHGCISEWVTPEDTHRLYFRKPAIRLSGGEFFMWPKKLNGQILSEDERLSLQRELIRHIRSELPDYDLWILTNGRFATDQRRSDNVLRRWAEFADASSARSKVRVCISVDVFHRPPPGSSINDMVKPVWKSSWEHGFMAPHLYGVPNQSIVMVGRAFEKFRPGKLQEREIKNVSKSSFNPLTYLRIEPNDLTENGGCQETKGFVVQSNESNLLGHNVYVSPTGELVYCCACLGSYGDFVNHPKECLHNIVTDPLAGALRKKESVIPLLELAVELDPTIWVLGTGKHKAVTGSTCYQLLSGVRPNGSN